MFAFQRNAALEITLRTARRPAHFAQKNAATMRHSHIPVPLAMLLLASCEPGENNHDAGSGISREQRESKGSTLPVNQATHEQLAAQDSIGRPPLSRNLIVAVEDICPVHHQKMTVCEIPIVFEEGAAKGAESGSPPATAAFPFGAEKIVSAGNALLPGEPLTARVYQCAMCVAARKAAGKKWKQAAPPSSPE